MSQLKKPESARDLVRRLVSDRSEFLRALVLGQAVQERPRITVPPGCKKDK